MKPETLQPDTISNDRIRGQSIAVQAALPITGLPCEHERPVRTCVFDFTPRLEVEARYELVKAGLKQSHGITQFDLLDFGPKVPHWTTDALVVLPTGLCAHLGCDSQKSMGYSAAACQLVQILPSVLCSRFINLLKNGGARLEPNTHVISREITASQQKGKPLQVYRVSVNPATWFTHEGEVYSLPSMYTSAITEFPGSPVRRIIPGDLVIFSTLMLGEPWILDQVGASACPNIGIPGTQVKGYGGSWSRRPACYRLGNGVCLGVTLEEYVDWLSGSLLVARG